jgi:hypothetical protein
MTRQPRAVLVTRPTEYELLLRRHATRGQAEFFLSTHGQRLADVEQDHQRFEQTLTRVQQTVPDDWRRNRISREDLDRFLFEPDDVVLVVGQDGLVANVAKYLRGQPVIGVNPDPDRYDGVLVRCSVEAAAKLLVPAAMGHAPVEKRTLVEAELDDGQRLLALNEIFVGHRSHQSARYRIGWHEAEERQSSSGLIVSTGTGATGWARSIVRQRSIDLALPEPTDGRLAFLVREAFPSVATGTSITEGCLDGTDELEVVSEMNEGGVVFGDGIEADHFDFGFGMRLSLRAAATRLCLVS